MKTHLSNDGELATRWSFFYFHGSIHDILPDTSVRSLVFGSDPVPVGKGTFPATVQGVPCTIYSWSIGPSLPLSMEAGKMRGLVVADDDEAANRYAADCMAGKVPCYF